MKTNKLKKFWTKRMGDIIIVALFFNAWMGDKYPSYILYFELDAILIVGAFAWHVINLEIKRSTKKRKVK
jgi:hypothetical protein